MTLLKTVLSQIPGNPQTGLQQADNLWQSLRNDALPEVFAINESVDSLSDVPWDVVVCGGTLGIFIGCTLAQQGWRVALVERGILRGRTQEWNISREEMQTFVELDLLSEAELAGAIASAYNPLRISFHGSPDFWVRDVLNIGIDPVFLLETLKSRFLAAGGTLLEQTAFKSATVHPNGVAIQAGDSQLNARLLLDVMGHFSPITKQARRGQSADAVCLVVGSCAQGFPPSDTGDLLVSFTPIQNQCQYFWEAFPARDGRTTYLFTYLDAHPQRPALADLFAEYLRLLPDYQQIELAQLQFQRALFGFFPCYRRSPLQSPWARILPAGDSSGSQSPLSFGGFGAMVRHLPRLTVGINEALQADALDRSALALLQPYQPNLSVTWLFQQTMSVGINQTLAPNQINDLLASIFAEMAALGDSVLRPFLQDVVQFSALSQTLLKANLHHPGQVAKVIPQVGLPALAGWLRHYLNLGAYSALYPIGKQLAPLLQRLPPQQQYYYHRWLQAWKYGSGGDYGENR